MACQDLLHAAGGQPVAGDVDHVVGTPHDEDIAVLVDPAAVTGEVTAVERGEVRPHEPVVVVPQRRQRPGRHRQLDHDGTVLVRGHRQAVAAEHPDIPAGERFRR